MKNLAGDIWRSLRNVAKLLLLTLGINLVGLLLNFIPGVGNILYTIVAYTSLVFFFGNQLFDCVLDRRRLPFSQKLKFSWHYRWLVFGAGTAFFLISMIPVFGFLSISLGTAGMTKVYVERLEQALLIEGRSAADVVA